MGASTNATNYTQKIASVVFGYSIFDEPFYLRHELYAVSDIQINGNTGKITILFFSFWRPIITLTLQDASDKLANITANGIFCALFCSKYICNLKCTSIDVGKM